MMFWLCQGSAKLPQLSLQYDRVFLILWTKVGYIQISVCIWVQQGDRSNILRFTLTDKSKEIRAQSKITDLQNWLQTQIIVLYIFGRANSLWLLHLHICSHWWQYTSYFATTEGLVYSCPTALLETWALLLAITTAIVRSSSFHDHVISLPGDQLLIR